VTQERPDTGDLLPDIPMVYVGAAVIVGLALIGFVGGTRGPVDPIGPGQSQGAGNAGESTVPRYDGMDVMSKRADVFASRLADTLPKLTGPVNRAGDLEAVRTKRASRRAYDGAPPTIPHAVRQIGKLACLACHDKGAKVGDKIAPAMSHEPYASCTQCHVPQTSPMATKPPPALTPNSFVGLKAPTNGGRAWAGAPPTIPHKVFMRQRCGSCHGVSGANPIRSTHPYRQSCRQCHVPNSATSLDQPRLDSALRQFGNGVPPRVR